jgi:glycosyltransferase involved in cell wall biosynthesis
MMDKLTLVIPAKNEAESLPKVLKEIEFLKIKVIVVIPVEDLSTRKSIKSFNCKIIQEENGKGYGCALRTGIEKVDTKFFCIFNADGSFDPKYLNEMLGKNKDNHEFVFSTRYKKPGGSDDDTILTFFGNYFFTSLCKILFRLSISDVLYTYVMGKTNAFKDLALSYNDFSFCVELPIKAKFKSFRVFDFPSYERPRISGKKKVNELKDGFLILISILKLFVFKK